MAPTAHIRPRSTAQQGLALLGVTALLVLAIALSIAFVDRPVAAFVARHQAIRFFFQLCAAPSLFTLPAAGVFLAYAVVRRLRGAGPVNRLWLVTSVATLAGTAAKDELKWIFGRPWPGTWLQYGTYRFHPLIDNTLYGGFPSGHTAYIAAPMGVLWVLVPQYRRVWGGLVALVMLGLVAAGYHFVGDVLAGLLTGILCAGGTLVLMGPHDV
jgi:membrane-associated phospholipid phosphatase